MYEKVPCEGGETLISVVGEFKPKGVPHASTFSHLSWPGKASSKRADITPAHLTALICEALESAPWTAEKYANRHKIGPLLFVTGSFRNAYDTALSIGDAQGAAVLRAIVKGVVTTVESSSGVRLHSWQRARLEEGGQQRGNADYFLPQKIEGHFELVACRGSCFLR
jgi:hypothetical protein